MGNKKLVFVLALVAFLLSAGASYSIFSRPNGSTANSTVGYKKPSTGDNSVDAESGEPKTEACPLNGKLYPKSQKAKWEARRPLAIMVENSKEARPQSGLSSADVIFEYVAEGGITRNAAIFYCQEPKTVGPVRSARVYFLSQVQGFGDHPLYAHVGGANTDGPADALGTIEKIGWAGYNDLNEFSVPFPNFWRDYERLPDRATEHTMYTSTLKLWDFAKAKRELTNVNEKGVAWDKNFTPWEFKDDSAAAKATATSISFGFWNNSLAVDYNVVWKYDAKTNSYKRENGGAPHIDKNTGKQLEAKNVIIAFADESEANDGYDHGQHMLYDTIGKNDALIFQDGKVIKGSWSKKDANTLVRFYDANGKEVSLNRGQVFIEGVPTDNKITY